MPDLTASRPVRLLHVEAEPAITEVFKKGLEATGFHVDCLNDPLEALACYKPSVYDVVLIGIRMEKMNGFDLARNIRKLDKDVRIILATAFELCIYEIGRLFRNEGVRIDGFILLPVTIPKLAEYINAVLANDGNEIAARYYNTLYHFNVKKEWAEENIEPDNDDEKKDKAKHGTGHKVLTKLYQLSPFVFLYLLLVMLQ